MDKEEILYALSKQTSTINYVQTNYGQIDLDEEMKRAVQAALENILTKQLKEIENG